MAAQNTATGFSGEPVPPGTTSGKTMSMNSYRPSAAHASATGSSKPLSTSPALDAHRLTWLARRSLPLGRVLQPPAGDGLVLGNARLGAKTGDVQQRAPRNNAVGRVGDRAKARPLNPDFFSRASPVPHAVLVP